MAYKVDLARRIQQWRKAQDPSVPLRVIAKAAGQSLALTSRAIRNPEEMSDRFVLRLSSGLTEFRECYSELRQIEDGLFKDPSGSAAEKAKSRAAAKRRRIEIINEMKGLLDELARMS